MEVELTVMMCDAGDAMRRRDSSGPGPRVCNAGRRYCSEERRCRCVCSFFFPICSCYLIVLAHLPCFDMMIRERHPILFVPLMSNGISFLMIKRMTVYIINY